VAVVVVVVVTAFNDWSKERQFRGLKKNVDRQHTISVVRDAQMTQLVVADIVVGDICVIKYGNLPAVSNRLWVAECSSVADLGFFRSGQATRFPSFSVPSFLSSILSKSASGVRIIVYGRKRKLIDRLMNDDGYEELFSVMILDAVWYVIRHNYTPI